MTQTGLDISLSFEERPVILVDEEGVKQNYTLREITGEERASYMSLVSSKARFTDDGKPAGMSSVKGLFSYLVQLSLRDAEGNRLPLERIQKFPARALSALFEAAHGLSDLDVVPKKDDEEDGDEEGSAGND